MKNLIQKAQQLGKKASEISQAMQQLPGQAAKVREAVTMSAGELHQLRSEVLANVNALKADSEERLLKAMREINDSTDTLEEAGYELSGMDLDLMLNHRLAVHLLRFDAVAQAQLRRLQTQEQCETVKSILGSIIKAEETAANIELTHLSYDGIVIHVGAVPMIRMLWRAESGVGETNVPAAVVAPAAVSPPSRLGTMFEQRSFPAGTIRVGEPVPAGASVQAVPTPPVPTVALPQPAQPVATASSWSQSALDRFKKMPNVSKY